MGYSLLPHGSSAQAAGMEFLVNTNTSNDQERAAITTLVNGSFVVVWQGKQNNVDVDIYGQMFNESGFQIGPEFLVNTVTTASQAIPSVHALKGGGYVTAWQSSQNVDVDAYAQRFDMFNNRVGSEFRINPVLTNTQARPVLVGLDNGGFIAVWDDDRGTNNDLEVYAQIYSPNGATAGSDFRVNTNSLNRQWYPDVTLLAGGNLVVVWMSDHTAGNDDNIYGQIITSSGGKVGNEFLINTNTTAGQQYPKVAGLKNGNFVVTWQSLQSGIDIDVFATIYNTSGSAIKSDFRVNTNFIPYSQYPYPVVTSLVPGGFVLAWKGGPGGDNIYAQVFDENGDAIGSEFRVNNSSNGYYPDLTSLRSGGFVVVWGSYQNGSYDIYGKMYDASAALVSSMVFPSTSMTPTPSASSSYITQTATTLSSPGPTNSFSSTAPQQPPSSRPFSASSIPPSQSLSSITPLISTILTTPIPTPSAVQTSGPQTLSSDESGCGQDCVSSYANLVGGILGGVASIVTIALGVFAVYKCKKNKTKEKEDIELQPSKFLDPKILKLLDGYPKAQHYWDVLSPQEQALIRAGRNLAQRANPNYKPLDITTSSEDSNEGIALQRWVLEAKDGPSFEIIPSITKREAILLAKQTGYQVNFGNQEQVQKIKLGSGHFGEVSIAQIKGKQTFVAVKVIEVREKIEQSKKEGRYHRELTGGPNILKFYASISDGGKLYHFIQLAGFGDGKQLMNRLELLEEEHQNSLLIKTALGLCNGLLHMHGKKLYHFDLKAENILFDQNGEVFISDFGSTQRERNDQMIIPNGDLRYASPEVRLQHQQLEQGLAPKAINASAQDAWGLGMVLVEMLGLFDPDHREATFETDMLEVLNLDNPQEGSLKYLILGLLQPNQDDRWTVQNAHDYLTQSVVIMTDNAREAVFEILARIPDADLD